jgi:hypothetical protein
VSIRKNTDIGLGLNCGVGNLNVRFGSVAVIQADFSPTAALGRIADILPG